MEDRAYRPIACDLHDRLEAAATLGRRLRVDYLDLDGSLRTIEDRIVDVFARGGEEFIRTGTGEMIRLDRLRRVDGIPFLVDGGAEGVDPTNEPDGDASQAAD